MRTPKTPLIIPADHRKRDQHNQAIRIRNVLPLAEGAQEVKQNKQVLSSRCFLIETMVNLFFLSLFKKEITEVHFNLETHIFHRYHPKIAIILRVVLQRVVTQKSLENTIMQR